MKNIPYEPEEMYYEVEPEKTQGTAMVAAGRKDYVDTIIALLEQAGLRPIGLHIEAIALRTALLPASQKIRNQGWMLIDIGLARTTVVFIVNGSIYFTTSYPSIVNQGTLQQENLYAALQQVVGYYYNHFAQRTPLNGILLCGSGAYIPNIAETITEYTKIPTQLGDVFQVIGSKGNKGMDRPLSYTTAFGLALLS